MSYVTLNQAKQAMRVTHSSDDALISRLIEAAETARKRFTGRTQLPTLPVDQIEYSSDGSQITVEDIPSSGDPVPADVVNGIILMVQADYEGDPTMRDRYRMSAEALWMPYCTVDRTGL